MNRLLIDNSNHTSESINEKLPAPKVKSHPDPNQRKSSCKMAYILLVQLIILSCPVAIKAGLRIPSIKFLLPPIYWKFSNPIFRIDNTLNMIDVEIGDSIDIVCPQYPRGTDRDDMEYYSIYRVTREEYDACHITFAHPTITRLVLNCSDPTSSKMFTLSFRRISPIPGGLEFKNGEEYYFTTTSTGKLKDINNREGGNCRDHAMKVTFKVGSKYDSQTGKTNNRHQNPNSSNKKDNKLPIRHHSSSHESKRWPTNENYKNLASDKSFSHRIQPNNLKSSNPINLGFPEEEEAYSDIKDGDGESTSDERINRAYPFDPVKYFKSISSTSGQTNKISHHKVVGEGGSRNGKIISKLPHFNFKNPEKPAGQEKILNLPTSEKLLEPVFPKDTAASSKAGERGSLRGHMGAEHVVPPFVMPTATAAAAKNASIKVDKEHVANPYNSYYYKQQQQKPVRVLLQQSRPNTNNYNYLSPKFGVIPISTTTTFNLFKQFYPSQMNAGNAAGHQQNNHMVGYINNKNKNNNKNEAANRNRQQNQEPKLDLYDLIVNSNNIDRRDSYLADQEASEIQQQNRQNSRGHHFIENDETYRNLYGSSPNSRHQKGARYDYQNRYASDSAITQLAISIKLCHVVLIIACTSYIKYAIYLS